MIFLMITVLLCELVSSLIRPAFSSISNSSYCFFFIISRFRRGLRGFSSCLVTLSSETTLDVRRFDFVKKLKI